MKDDCSYENCLSCSNNRCVQCVSGYELIGNACLQKTAKSCKATNCESCPQNDTCLKCVAGFSLIDGECLAECQIDNCEKCVEGKCLKCKSSFSLEEGKCAEGKCSLSNCKTCSDSKTCSSCEEKFSLFEDACYVTQCVYPCLLCDTSSSCFIYESWYYEEKSSDNNCNISNCLKCGSESKCSLCDIGFYIDQEGLCVASTIVCESGFYPSENDCLKCGVGCKDCFHSTMCLNCYSTFLLEKGTCIEKEPVTIGKSDSPKTACVKRECLLDGVRMASQCDNCHVYCDLKFDQVTSLDFRLKSEEVTFYESETVSTARKVSVFENSIEISFPQNSQGIRIFTVPDSMIKTAYCKIKNPNIFTFFVGKMNDEDIQNMNAKSTVMAVMTTSIGFISGLLPGFLSLLQLNHFFNLYYIISEDPSFIFGIVNKMSTTIIDVNSLTYWRDKDYYEVRSIFRNSLIGYFQSAQKQKITLFISIFVISIVFYYRVHAELKKSSGYRSSQFFRFKKRFAKIISRIKPVIFTLGVQVLADLQSTIVIWVFRTKSLSIPQILSLVTVTLVFVKFLEEMIFGLRNSIKFEISESTETIFIASEMVSLIESMCIFFGVVFICCFQFYLKLLQFFFLVASLVKFSLLVYFSFIMRQRVLLIIAGSETFFILFLIFNFFQRITLYGMLSYEDLFYLMANFMQLIYLIANFVISRNLLKDV